MHPQTRLRNSHYLKRVRKEIDKKHEDSDLWKRFIIRFKIKFGKNIENRPILDDEHPA